MFSFVFGQSHGWADPNDRSIVGIIASLEADRGGSSSVTFVSLTIFSGFERGPDSPEPLCGGGMGDDSLQVADARSVIRACLCARAGAGRLRTGDHRRDHRP